MVVKIEFTPLSLDRKIFPFKKGFKKMSSLRLLVLKIEFCPNMGKGVAVFAMFANIFEFVTSLLWYLGIISD